MGFSFNSGAVIMHWNGRSWGQVPGTLDGIAASSAKNAWAVGGSGTGIILHWNGKSWN